MTDDTRRTAAARQLRYCPMCDERVPTNDERECRICGADTVRLPKGDV